MNDLQRLIQRRHGPHLLTTALMGKTADHLAQDHGVSVTSDRRENARRHLEAHPTKPEATAQ